MLLFFFFTYFHGVCRLFMHAAVRQSGSENGKLKESSPVSRRSYIHLSFQAERSIFIPTHSTYIILESSRHYQLNWKGLKQKLIFPSKPVGWLAELLLFRSKLAIYIYEYFKLELVKKKYLLLVAIKVRFPLT